MSDNILVKVIRKEADGATIQSLDGKIRQKMTWADFKKYLHPTKNEYEYEIIIPENETSEFDREYEIQKWMTKNTAYILMFTNPDKNPSDFTITQMAVLGQLVKEYGELFGGSQMDFIEHAKWFRKSTVAILSGEILKIQ